MKKYILLLGTVLSLGLYSCSDEWMGDVIPTDKIEANEAFNTLKDGRNAVNGVLSLMQSEDYYGANYIVYGDLKAIDVRSKVIGKRNVDMYRYTETTEAGNATMWTRPYTSLVSINNAIDNLEKLPATGDEETAYKAEIEANFYALRALNHFDLLKVFARIPASLTGDLTQELGIVLADHVITKDEKPARENLDLCYKFVIEDLKFALDLMPEAAATEGWMNKTAIKALLARVYLYYGENQLAYNMAKEVIDAGDYTLVSYADYEGSWKASSSNSEAIFTLINTDADNPAREGVGNLWNKDGYNTMSITSSFMDLMDPADIRNKSVFIDEILNEDGSVKEKSYLSTKFPSTTTNKLHLIRLSEMYFIAAEAIYNVSAANAGEAAALINIVLKERTDVDDVLTAVDINIDNIILEKRKEFVAEGHTFFDLMRNKMDVVRTGDDHLNVAPMTIKYDNFKTIQPIPRMELNVNKTIQQNPGYAGHN